MPQGPGFSWSDHGAVAVLTLAALLLAAVLLRPGLRRRLGPDHTLALVCFMLPFAAVWIASWASGHYW